MATQSRKTTSRRAAKTTPVAARAVEITPSDGQQRQLMLLMLERKFRTLMSSAQELMTRLADPNEPRTAIEASLAENGIERQAVLAKHAAIEAGEPFAFPAESELENLRKAMAKLEAGIAQTAATEALIVATSEVINAVRQS